MFNDNEFIEFIKKNANLFKKFTVAIPISDKNYEFNIVSITDNAIKLQYKFDYSYIVSSKKGCVEYLLKNIIVEDSNSDIYDSFSLSQRARSKRKLKGYSFKVLIGNYVEELKIGNISQYFLTIEKVLEFNNFKKTNDDDIYSIL